jgi:hypothetical protein
MSAFELLSHNKLAHKFSRFQAIFLVKSQYEDGYEGIFPLTLGERIQKQIPIEPSILI